MKISDVIACIEEFAPTTYQESYDNSGLLVGDKQKDVSKVLISLDVTEDIVQEAVECGAQLIIAHHPILFKGLKKLTPDTYVQRTILSAIKNDVAIYAAHTNADTINGGVNHELADVLGLKNVQVLQPVAGKLRKLYCYVPVNYVESLRNEVFKTGAGNIGKYDYCSFNSEGDGTFRPSENTDPFVGEIGELHTEREVKVEVVFPVHLQSKVVSAVKKAHPYEEPAYDIIMLDNDWDQIGIGLLGEMQVEMTPFEFLDHVKKTLNVPFLKYTDTESVKIRKVALCGGSGSFLIGPARRAGADVLLTGDVKYHEFFDSENKLMIVDAGHYETEQFTKELFYRVIRKKFPNFAVQISNRNTNPVNYY